MNILLKILFTVLWALIWIDIFLFGVILFITNNYNNLALLALIVIISIIIRKKTKIKHSQTKK